MLEIASINKDNCRTFYITQVIFTKKWSFLFTKCSMTLFFNIQDVKTLSKSMKLNE